MHNKIQQKCQEWQAAGLLSERKVQALFIYEQQKKYESFSWGLILFATLGALVLGLGVILVVAYNWSELHKFTKLAVLFGAFLTAHGIGLYLRHSAKPLATVEAAHFLGSMLFGASIWLIAQIYHVSAHYPDALLLWGLGALLMAWSMSSITQGVLAACLFCIWAGAEATQETVYLWGLLLPLLGTGMLAWRLRSTVLACISGLSLTLMAVCGIRFPGDGTFLMFCAASLFLGSTACLARTQNFTSGAGALHLLGGITLFFFLFPFSFFDLTQDILLKQDPPRIFSEHAKLGIVLFAVLGLTIWTFWQMRAKKDLRTPFFLRGVCVPFLFFAPYALYWTLGMKQSIIAEEFFCLLANILFLGLIFEGLWRGSLSSQTRVLVGHFLLFTAWTLARFQDLFDSLLLRGLAFLALGLVFFYVALRYQRLGQKQEVLPGGRAL